MPLFSESTVRKICHWLLKEKFNSQQNMSLFTESTASTWHCLLNQQPAHVTVYWINSQQDMSLFTESTVSKTCHCLLNQQSAKHVTACLLNQQSARLVTVYWINSQQNMCHCLLNQQSAHHDTVYWINSQHIMTLSTESIVSKTQVTV